MQIKTLNKQELLNIVGGISITGTLINSISKAVNIVLDIGRSLGSAIRRIGTKTMCRL